MMRLLAATLSIGLLVQASFALSQSTALPIGDTDTASDDMQIVQPSRGYGHTVGDLLHQRVILAEYLRIDALLQLPPLQREGQWLSRIAVNTDTVSNVLSVTYQIINSPEAPITILLPALILEHTETALKIEPWPVSIVPLTPIELPGDGDLIAMQPDSPPALPDTQKSRKQLQVSATVLAGTFMIWILWWLLRNYRDKQQLPFANAYRLIRHMDRSSRDSMQAWQILHKAINDSAQRTVHTSSVHKLLDQKPWLEPLNGRLHDFFRASDQRFFQAHSSDKHFPILELSKDLYLLERRETRGQPLIRFASGS